VVQELGDGKEAQEGQGELKAKPPGDETPEQELERLKRENNCLRKENETLRMDREILKKSSSLLREGKRMKFAFIHAEKASFPVAALCRLLGVTRQGYYAYAKPRPEERSRNETHLRERLRALHADSRGTYGSPRLLAAVRAEGLRVGKRRVERAMRSMGLFARMRRRFRVTTRANPAHPVVSNVLDRRFQASKPNERWVTDITYVWTEEGWCYWPPS
jgi:hypothetical protein